MAQKQKMECNVFLTPKELVARWKNQIHVRTLDNWRQKKYGPKFVKIGKEVLYSLEEVEAWEKKQTFDSTARYA